MNPTNFPDVGGAMPGGDTPHGQMQVPQKNHNEQVIMKNVAQALQAQGPFTGWRTEVPVKDRAVKVYQMITSLRLIQPRIDFQSAAQAAMSFEQKAFKDAREKVDYEKECNEKLIHIRDTRARQATILQGGMMPQGPAAGMPRVAQKRPQQRPDDSASFPDDLGTLSAQEYEHVCRIANQILAKTPQEDMEKIRMNLQNMTPEQRQYLTRKKMDPVTYFFRSHALAQLRRHKRNRMEMARAQSAGVDSNGAMMGNPIINPQQRQMFQNMMNLQTAQFQSLSQAQTQAQAQARAQAAQKAQMAISSQAGQANSQMLQQFSQQDSTMPILSRPMAPGRMPPMQALTRLRMHRESQNRTDGTSTLDNGVVTRGADVEYDRLSGGPMKKRHLQFKNTISEDLCQGEDADRLKKIRKIESRSKRQPFQSDRWKAIASCRTSKPQGRTLYLAKNKMEG